MKLFILLLFFPFLINAQSQNEYKTKSGYIYQVNDTLLLGKPSTLLNSMLIGSSSGSWNKIFKLNDKNLKNVNYIDKKVVITKIELTENSAKLYFELFKQKLYCLIDEAILSGEVILPLSEQNLNDNDLDKYDKIKKLKELLDIGAISKDEFEIEKNKLLNS